MTNLIRCLLALALAIGLVLPVVGGEGGENGGGTGVWILPRANFLSTSMSVPRDTRTIPVNVDAILQVSNEVGVCSATSLDGLTGLPVSLPVVGNQVVVTAALLQSIGSLPSKCANVVIADASQVGYLVRITVLQNGTALVQVF
jgi:hypothetical protein